MRFEDLSEANQHEARALILAGLIEHWGSLDLTLNPDLDDMAASYQSGRTVLVRDGGGTVVGTGTVLPRGNAVAEIIRMSVARNARRHGIGRHIVDELVRTATEWGVEKVVLETTTSWEEAVSFYVRCGFSITHVEADESGSDTWFELQLSGRDIVG